MLLSNSRSNKFYSFLLSKIVNTEVLSSKNILYRVLLTSHKYYINFNEYICDTTYFLKMQETDTARNTHNTENKGQKDTVLFLLQFDCDRSRILLNNFLLHFDFI